MASRNKSPGGGNIALKGTGGAAAQRSGGVSDLRTARAWELHEQAVEAERRAAQLRAERDRLIRQLRDEDSECWSYGTLAKVIGCNRKLVAQVSKRR